MNPVKLSGRLEKIADDIFKTEGVPVDYLHVAAALEVMGYTDNVIRDSFGYSDSFTLSKKLMHRIGSKGAVRYAGGDRRKKEGRDWRLLLSCLVRGGLLLFPVMLSLLFFVFGSGSIWGQTRADATNVNSLALALVLSMIITGGYARSLSHRLSEAKSNRVHGDLIKLPAIYISLAAFSVAIASFAVLAPLGSGFNEPLLVGNAIFLSFIWMSIAIFFAVGRDWMFAPLYSLGVAMAIMAKLILGLNFIETEVLGTILVATILLAAGVRMLSRTTVAAGKTDIRSSFSLLLGKLFSGQFFFGMLYFSLLFADRVVNWTSQGVFAFHPSYEVSLDLAIFSLLFGTGILEYRMTLFWRKIINCRRSHQVPVSSVLKRFFLKSILAYAAAAAAGIGISVALTYVINSGQNRGVVLAAAPAYALVAWGAFVCNIFIGFKRSIAVTAMVAAALVVDLLVGIWFLSHGDANMTAAGLLAGGAVFFIGGCVFMVHIIRNFSYLHYASI